MREKWLYVKKAIAPELILWDNLGVSKCARFGLILLSFIITLILICGTIYIIMLSKYRQIKAAEYSPAITCNGQNITMTMAMYD